MNLLEMIKNEKVEWKELGEISKCFSGGTPKTINKAYYNGTISWIRSGEINFKPIYESELKISLEGLNNSSAKLIRPKSVLIAMTGATVGRIATLEFESSCNQSVAVIENDEDILDYKYLFYYLSNNYFYLKNMGQGALTSLNLEKIKKIKIPIPTLETQEKIVKTLDKFTKYVTELQAELQAELRSREKQYEYYREMLLSEEYLLKKMENSQKKINLNVEWKSLKEISKGNLSYGSNAKSINYDGNIRYIRITDIDDSGNLKLEKVSPDTIEEKYILNKNDILFARSGATVGKNYLHVTEEKCIFAGYLIRLIVDEKIALPKYVYHCINTNNYKIFVKGNKTSASQPNINAQQYGNFKIPIVPLNIQERIVYVLDNFEKVCNDLNIGLPKEIELRQKQYEYFREKLLTFEKESPTISSEALAKR